MSKARHKNARFESISFTDIAKQHLERFLHLTAFSDAVVVDEAQSFMDAEMANLHDALLLIRARRNAISRISRLPAEILSYIFRFSADIQDTPDADVETESSDDGEAVSDSDNDVMEDSDYASDDEEEYSEQSSLSSDCENESGSTSRVERDVLRGWLCILHVCRRWRQIALEDIGLWTRITYNTSPRWLEAILARAQTMSLIVHRELSDHSHKRELTLIGEHLSHIKDLTLIGSADNLAFATRKRLNNPAPILESLTVTVLPGTLDDEITVIAALPANIFAKTAPKLHRICLHNCHLHWESPLLTDRITDFHLTYSGLPNRYVGPGRRNEANWMTSFRFEPSRDQLLTSLRRMPALRHLALRRCICGPPRDEEGEELPEDPGVVEFESLESLELNGWLVGVVEYMTHIRMPSTTSVTLSGLAFSDPDELVTPLSTYIRILSASGDFPAMAVSFVDSTQAVRVQLWRDCVTDRDTPNIPSPENQRPALSIELGWPRTSKVNPFTQLRSLCKALPLDTLKVLSIRFMYANTADSEYGFLANRWPYLFKRCIAVEHLIVNSQAAEWISAELIMHVDTDAERATWHEKSSHALFGSLRVLSIDFVRLGEEGTLTQRFLESLPRNLAVRRDAGLGLSRFQVGRCRNVEQWRKILGRVVDVGALPEQTYFCEDPFWAASLSF